MAKLLSQEEVEEFFKAPEPIGAEPVTTNTENVETEKINDNSIKKRWKHHELFDVGYVAVPSHFLELYAQLNPSLTSGEALFVVQLMNFKWTEKEPFPSYAVLAKRMGVTDKAVRRYAAALEGKKYLVRRRRVGKTNTFDLNKLFDALLDVKNKVGRKPTQVKRGKK
jgi:hypothetical protein